jgi:DNA replication ATP-dependent helicase Dna2
VRDISSEALFTVVLRDSWFAETGISAGIIVHVVGSFDKRGCCVVDNKHNYIILNPDILVSATTVADTVSCMRKAALQERVKATGDFSKAMVYGNVLHSLLQSALTENDFSTERLRLHTERILIDNIESLYLLREDLAAAAAHVESKFHLLQDWARLFVSSTPNVSPTVL